MRLKEAQLPERFREERDQDRKRDDGKVEVTVLDECVRRKESDLEDRGKWKKEPKRRREDSVVAGAAKANPAGQ